MMLASMSSRFFIYFNDQTFNFSCDQGGDCECLCTSLSAFAERCQANNIPVKWRTQDRCRKYF